MLMGFQSLTYHPELPERWADIATYTRMEPKTPGVGTALFAATNKNAPKFPISDINATIRSDNTGGLAYYQKCGFIDYAISEGIPLNDGTIVDRISKRYQIS